jgi:hypothetical protein
MAIHALILVIGFAMTFWLSIAWALSGLLGKGLIVAFMVCGCGWILWRYGPAWWPRSSRSTGESCRCIS